MAAVEPTPAAQRTFGLLDQAALWGSLGFGLLMLTPGALLVPALGIGQAVLAVLVAALLGGLLLALIGGMAAQRGLSSLALLRTPLGSGGSYLAAALIVARNVAWGAFALVLAAEAAAAVSDDALGAGLRPLWVLVFGAAGLGLVVIGPQWVVRQLLKKAGLWLALLIAIIITVSAYAEFGVPTLLQRPAVGGWPSFWQAVDVIIVLPLLWLPLVADYARFSRSTAGAISGTFAGTFLAVLWFGFLGILYLPAVESGEVIDFILGMQVGLLALVLILVLQSDEVFANAYSAGVSLRAVIPWAGDRALAVAAGSLAVGLALGLDLLDYEGFLLLLGAIFVPLFGVLAASFVLTRPGLAAEEGREHWLDGSALAAWALGFLLYQWIAPSDVEWWRDAMHWLFSTALRLPFPLTDEVTWLGASLPAFLAGFVLYTLATPGLRLVRRSWYRRAALAQ